MTFRGWWTPSSGCTCRLPKPSPFALKCKKSAVGGPSDLTPGHWVGDTSRALAPFEPALLPDQGRKPPAAPAPWPGPGPGPIAHPAISTTSTMSMFSTIGPTPRGWLGRPNWPVHRGPRRQYPASEHNDGAYGQFEQCPGNRVDGGEHEAKRLQVFQHQGCSPGQVGPRACGSAG
jgi:hypothetical protein